MVLATALALVASAGYAQVSEVRIGALFPMFKTQARALAHTFCFPPPVPPCTRLSCGTGRQLCKRLVGYPPTRIVRARRERNQRQVRTSRESTAHTHRLVWSPPTPAHTCPHLYDPHRAALRCGRTDGIADDLLPNTQLVFAYRDSKRDDSASFFGALELTQSAFDGKGVSAIVGAASSGPSMSAALVAKRAMVPQISYSSTSALLSDGKTYSYFLRTPPSDAFQGEGLADLIQNLFQYKSVASVASTDGYGAAGISAFLSAAARRGLTVLASVSFAKDSSTFTDQYRELVRSQARIIVIFCQASDAGLFMKGALEEGIGGAGFMWLGSDALSGSSLWTNNGVMVEEALQLQVLKGFFALRPSVGQGTAAYAAYMARVRAMPSTLPTGSTCNLATDDDFSNPTYIWAQDEDNNASSPLACGGTDNQAEGSYAPYAYDAVYAIAHALHHLIEVEGKTSVVGAELMDVLVKDVNFEGITGVIDFHDGSTHPDQLYNGDRRVGIAYDVLNYASTALGLVTVGKWTPVSDSEWVQRWQQVGNLTYSTEDNSQPPDVVELTSCSSGYVLTLEAGFVTCRACAAGSYEVEHRRAALLGHAPPL